MVRIQAIADAHDLGILEDAAQAVGSSFRGQKVGSWGTAASFSLHPLKSLHAFGDAGILTARDERIIQDVALRKNHGLVDRGTCAEWSFNCRLDEVQAAMLRVLLKELPGYNTARRAGAEVYRELGLGDVLTVPEDEPGHVYHLFVCRSPQRDAIRAALGEQGIATATYYTTPLHLQPAMRQFGYKAGDLPVTEAIAADNFSLPLWAGIDGATQQRVADAVLQAAR